jgi:uncharacterized membrane protein HdeD (DUF308 family)
MDVSSILLIRGIVGVAVGVIAFTWPGITIAALVMVFGAYAIVDGITNLFLGFSRKGPRGQTWAHVLQGIFGIAAGVLTFVWPGITALVLVAFIGAWAILTGVMEVIAAIRLRRVITGEWMLILSGAMSVLFGILVLAFPGAGAISISWILGIYAAAAGFLLIGLSVRLRSAVYA